MTIRFVCLANSIKEKGRCLAGIELNKNNEAIIGKNGPKWIRPICKTSYGQIPMDWVKQITLMDIVEIELTGFPAKPSYQSENVFFKDGDLKVVGRFKRDNLDTLCDNHYYIFSNWGKALSVNEAALLNYSLILINVSKFEVIEKIDSENIGKKKTRLRFYHNETIYDFPITDPKFLYLFKINPRIMDVIKTLYLCISVGRNFNDKHYKLVAGIIPASLNSNY